MRPKDQSVGVTLKLATSLDGRIATASGESKWITGEPARAKGHRLRASHDAILVGVETVLADDPELTARPSPLAGEGIRRSLTDGGAGSAGTLARDEREAGSPPIRAASPPTFPREGGRQPLRVVLDTRLRTPPSAKIASGNSLILTAAEPHPIGEAEVVSVDARDGRPGPEAVLAALSERGVGSLLIEGGGQVAASFLRAGLVDRLEWFRAPVLLGEEGRPCVAALALSRLSDAPRFRRLAVEACGDDLWERYERL